MSDILQALAALFAGIACLRVGRDAQAPGWTRGWHLIGYGVLAWAAGDVVWTYYGLVLDEPDPELSLADVGFLAMVPLMLWGVTRLIGLHRDAAMGLIESLLVAGSLLYLSWAVVLDPMYRQARVQSPPWLQWSVNLAYPLGDLAIATAALILLGSLAGGQRIPIALLAAGALALAFSDSAYVALATTYHSGTVLDVGWLAGFFLIGLAAILARSHGAVQPQPGTERTPAPLILPYIPLSAAAITSIALAAGHHPPSLVLAVLLVTLFGLVLARQVLALRERQALTADLHNSLQQVREQQAILNRLAFSDPLTGLANRAVFEEHLALPQRRARGDTAVMFIDLDDFKEINDRFGHEGGDAVLVAVASRLRASSRIEDTVVRIGGDEFLVMVEGGSADAVEPIARRFLAMMREPIMVHGTPLIVGVSIGTAFGGAGDADIHELVRRADAAMYAAKLAGKRRYASS